MLNPARSRLLATRPPVAGLEPAPVAGSLLFFLARKPLAERRVYPRLEVVAEATAG